MKHDYTPGGIRFGTDIYGLIKAAADNTWQGWEVNADVDFYKYYLVADYGSWGNKFSSPERQYDNLGTYLRIGADVNILKNDPDNNMFYFGVRYGSANFWEKLTTAIYDDRWGSTNLQTYYNPAVNAHWLEAVTGLRIKVWKELWLGYTCRFKFGLSTSNAPEMIPADVPGYGRTDGVTWGFNYQVFWRIPFRKK